MLFSTASSFWATQFMMAPMKTSSAATASAPICFSESDSSSDMSSRATRILDDGR
jgi:hypothetical protein